MSLGTWDVGQGCGSLGALGHRLGEVGNWQQLLQAHCACLEGPPGDLDAWWQELSVFMCCCFPNKPARCGWWGADPVGLCGLPKGGEGGPQKEKDASCFKQPWTGTPFWSGLLGCLSET